MDVAHGQLLSIPTSNSRWTDKYLPGLDKFAYYKTEQKLLKHLGKYLGRLIEFAKHVLQDKEEEWHNYPIYLKATGGLRTLPQQERVRIMNAVRTLFNDHENFNPFSFEDERARVISGEEEAIYGWVGVNFGAYILRCMVLWSVVMLIEIGCHSRGGCGDCCQRYLF